MFWVIQILLQSVLAQKFDWPMVQHQARMNKLGVSSTKEIIYNNKRLNGQGIVVAVIDSGVDLSHPDLKNKVIINTNEIPHNFIDDDRNGYIDDIYGWNFYENSPFIYDDHGHGTHVAGIIAGEKYGVAPESKILPIKVTGATGEIQTTQIIKAIEYAVKRGAKVINLSLAGIGRMYFEKYQEEKMIQLARTYNVLIVAAAGNESINTTYSPVFPANHMSDNLLAVCATDDQDYLATFSNFSSLYTHVCAPGVDIYSTYLQQKYVSMSGTSMAAPIVSGIAAILYSGNPYLESYKIRNAIVENTDKKNSLKNMSLSEGVINAYKSAKKIYKIK